MNLPFTYLLWGIAFGLIVSVPVGPINILCLRRALFGRPIDGVFIGMGAAVGDALYAALAAFGLNAIFKFIENYETLLLVIGGVILAVFASRIWSDQPHLRQEPIKGKVKRSALAAFAITITNPGVFVGFLGLYTLAGIGHGQSIKYPYGAATALALGVFVGAVVWWFVLAYGASAFKDKVNNHTLIQINKAAAIGVALFAVVALCTALLSL